MAAMSRTPYPHRSRVFLAKFESTCPRCRLPISVDDAIRYHEDYPRPVHDGCKDQGNPPSYIVRGARMPSLCAECFMEHVGECP